MKNVKKSRLEGATFRQVPVWQLSFAVECRCNAPQQDKQIGIVLQSGPFPIAGTVPFEWSFEYQSHNQVPAS